MVDIVETRGSARVTIMTHGTMFIGAGFDATEILLAVQSIPDLIAALQAAQAKWHAAQAELAAAEPAFREAA